MFAAKNLLLTPPPSTSSAPVYDNSAISAAQSGTPAGTAFTFTETVAAGSYAVVAVYGALECGGLPASNTVKVGGVTLASKGNVSIDNNPSGSGWIWVYGGDISSAGSGSKTVSVTPSADLGFFYGYASCHTYTGVTSVGSLQTAFGNSTSPSRSVTSASGDRVWGSIATALPGNSFSAFSLTQRKLQTSSDPSAISGDTTGSATVTVSATISSDAWAAAGINLI